MRRWSLVVGRRSLILRDAQTDVLVCVPPQLPQGDRQPPPTPSTVRCLCLCVREPFLIRFYWMIAACATSSRHQWMGPSGLEGRFQAPSRQCHGLLHTQPCGSAETRDGWRGIKLAGVLPTSGARACGSRRRAAGWSACITVCVCWNFLSS